jgi:putative flippase GtrA
MSRDLLARLIRFGLVGGTVTVFAYVSFMALLRLGVHYLPASVGVWVVGVALNYLLSRSFTFAAPNAANPREFGAFVTGALIQLAIGTGIYSLLIGVLKIDPTVAFCCNVVVGSAFSFAFMRWIVFARPAPRRP